MRALSSTDQRPETGGSCLTRPRTPARWGDFIVASPHKHTGRVGCETYQASRCVAPASKANERLGRRWPACGYHQLERQVRVPRSKRSTLEKKRALKKMRSGIAAGVKEPAAARRCEAARTGQKKSRAMGEGQKKALFSSGPSCREDGVPWNSATATKVTRPRTRACEFARLGNSHRATRRRSARAAAAGRNAKVRGLGVANQTGQGSRHSSFRVSRGGS